MSIWVAVGYCDVPVHDIHRTGKAEQQQRPVVHRAEPRRATTRHDSPRTPVSTHTRACAIKRTTLHSLRLAWLSRSRSNRCSSAYLYVRIYQTAVPACTCNVGPGRSRVARARRARRSRHELMEAAYRKVKIRNKLLIFNWFL
jgi:hypothetical protein